ncbi:MAG: heparan-alpha-glucosaminide N-acetyltransferase domain-containing protein [Candidatus Helarchaeota archaeon]
MESSVDNKTLTNEPNGKNVLKRIPRIHSIDLFRAMGILIMIIGHFGLWFIDGDEISWPWWDYVPMWSGTIGAPFFLICVGFSLVFYVANKQRRGFSEKEIRNAVLRRGGFLWGFGYILNLFLEELSRWWIWNIIVLIGCATIITYFTLKLTIKQRILISSILLVLNPISQLIGILHHYNMLYPFFSFHPTWIEIYMLSSFQVKDLWNPFALNMVLIGSVIGSYTLDKIKEGKIEKLPKSFFIWGILLCIFGASIDVNLRYGGVMPLILEFEHEIHIIFSTGIFLSFFAFFFWYQDVKKYKSVVLDQITILGSISFTIFVAHHLFAKYFFAPIFRGAFAPFNFYTFTTKPFLETLFFQILMHPANLITTYALQIITLTFTIFFWIVAVVWNRFKLKYSLEWAIRKLS